MKKHILLLFCLLPISLFAQFSTPFSKTYLNNGDERCSGIAPLPNNHTLMLVDDNDHFPEATHLFYRINALGKIYHQSVVDLPNAFSAFMHSDYTPDGHLLVAVSSTDGPYIAKIDTSGTVLWTHEFANFDIHSIKDFGMMPSGNIYVLLHDQSNQLLVMDQSGNLISDFNINNCALNHATPAANGDFLLAGSIPGDTTNADAYLLRVDSVGNEIWATHFGGLGSDGFGSLLEYPNGDVLVASYIDPYIPDAGTDVWLSLYTSSGDSIWHKPIAGGGPSGLKFSLDSQHVFLSVHLNQWSFTAPFTYYSTSFYKLDLEGNFVCAQFANESTSDINKVLESSDGSLRWAGNTATEWVAEDVWLMQMDSTCGLGPLGTAISNPSNFSLAVFPNPMQDVAVVQFPQPINSTFQVSVLNVSGKVVQAYSAGYSNQIEIERNNLPSGLYFVRIDTDFGKSYSGKLVVK